MSQHDLVSAWNHAEHVVAVSPLTTNWCLHNASRDILV